MYAHLVIIEIQTLSLDMVGFNPLEGFPLISAQWWNLQNHFDGPKVRTREAFMPIYIAYQNRVYQDIYSKDHI